MISICTSSRGSDLAAEFRTWVEAEWGNVDSFEGTNEKVLPAPILAVRDGVLVGGLSFTYSTIPGTKDVALWINTLLVIPELRRMGIGTQLISAAESSVGDVGVDEVYVFTEVDGMYRKLGWQVHSNAGASKVLKKGIVRGQSRT